MRAVVTTVVLLGAGATAGWAATTALSPTPPVTATSYTYVAVRAGTVGASIELNAVARWTSSPVGANQAAGVVTAVLAEPGEEVSQGRPSSGSRSGR